MAPDFERAKQYAFERLKNELASYLIYHDLAHTQDDVLPATTRLARLTRINRDDLLLLETAAIYHDIGFVEHVSAHESASVKIVAETLPGFGYNQTQVQTIIAIIMATKLPQTPQDLLGELLADADLDVLGREDFFENNQQLRLELEARGIYQTDEAWFSDQLNFLESHGYFTAAANSLRAQKKQENITALKHLLNV